jgi:signal transduction histidine kinase
LHVPQEIQSGVIEELHQRAQAEGIATGIFRRRRKDGSEFLARLTVTIRKDAQGNAKGYFVFSHDVTAEQRHVEEQRFLARVGETLQSSLDYATTIDCIARLTIGFLGDGCAIDVLEAPGKLGRKKVVHADVTKAGFAEALQHILPARGHPVWTVLETNQPLLFPEVSADLLRSIANDDEHLRLLEAIGIQSVMHVPLVARDRLLAVLSTVWCRPGSRYRNEDLVVAQEFARRAALALDNALLYDVAQTAIRTRDQILGFVAHDLRNPLGTIVSSAALLRRLSADAGGSRRPVDAIERAAIRMNRLIQDLLDVTRMEGGVLPIEPGVIGTRQAIADCIDAHQDLAASAFLSLESDVAADVADVWADRDRLFQVFENLIGNAVKFTAHRGSIVIGARSQDRGVQFWVRDSGMGIAEEEVPQLFDRFWQADNVRRQGTGLGLPIVKGIVEAHGGRIWVESVKGRGSTFFFTIPAVGHASANLP